MSDQPVLDGALVADLRAYFAITAATELPRGVSTMSVGRLSGRRSRRPRGLLPSAVGLAAAVALVVVAATHLGVRQGAENSSLAGGSAAEPFRPAVTSPAPAAITYPGIDLGRLAAGGVVLVAPGGHGEAIVGAPQAQSVAVRAGTGSGSPGPAVLAFAEVATPSLRTACLCWVVDVPLSGESSPSAGAASEPRTELVLIDADSGRVVGTLTGNGIP